MRSLVAGAQHRIAFVDIVRQLLTHALLPAKRSVSLNNYDLVAACASSRRALSPPPSRCNNKHRGIRSRRLQMRVVAVLLASTCASSARARPARSHSSGWG